MSVGVDVHDLTYSTAGLWNPRTGIFTPLIVGGTVSGVESNILRVAVKERIFKFLQEVGGGVSATRILADLLNVRSRNRHSSDSVLAGFLGQDPRFVFSDGLWHLSSLVTEPRRLGLTQVVVLHVRSVNRGQGLQGLRGAIRSSDDRLDEFKTPASANIVNRLRARIDGNLLVVWSRREFVIWNGLLRSLGLESWQGDTLYLRNLAGRVLKRMTSNFQHEELASELGLSPVDEDRPRDVARYLNDCWLLLLDRVPAECCRDLQSLRDWMDDAANAVDFSHFAFGRSFLRQLPRASGVYLMRDRENTVIYVGKARNLKRRISSYFTPHGVCRPKVARIHELLHSIEVRRTDNEIEALLMETRMIKKFRPAVNVQTQIHARQVDRHRGRNLLLFVAGAGEKGVKIYLFCNGIFAGRHAALLGHPPSVQLLEKLMSLYFTQGRKRRPPGRIWERELVSRWFAINRKRLNYLDVDEMEDFASVLERLHQYLHDPEKLTRRVYYR